jgi:hypothetical protein
VNNDEEEHRIAINDSYKHGRYTAEAIASRRWLRHRTRGDGNHEILGVSWSHREYSRRARGLWVLHPLGARQTGGGFDL